MPYSIVPLSQGKSAIIDAHHAHAVRQHSWHVNKGAAKSWINGSHVTLARFIARLSGLAIHNRRVFHISSDRFDNRTFNLEVKG